ncbi:MAG: fimbrillin family protein [Alistipes sp.]|nr:fimbrillin family protein [Alistipes sp.]
MKYLHLPLAVLLCAMVHIACSTDNSDDAIVEGDIVNMTIIAEQTRTHLNNDGTKVEWNDSGEYLMVYQSAEGNTISNKSGEAVITDGLAKFGVSFSTSVAQSFEYNAVYPAASVAADATPSVDDVVFTLPVAQRPSATSFDSAADLLVARSITTTTQSESLNMAFKRMVAIGRLSLAGVDDMDIASVELRVPDAHLAGSLSLNLSEGHIAEYNTTSDCITITYDQPIDASQPIFFTLLPTTIEANESFIVSVYDTSGNALSREVRLPRGRSLSFAAGDMTIFKVNMDDKGSEDANFGAIAGEWHLTEWCGMSNKEFDFDIYLDIDASGSLTLWQRLTQHSWEKFTSTASIDNGVISGTYSDSTAWGSDYYISVSGDTMTWTNTADPTDVSIYTRADIPDNVAECEALSSKFSAPLL